MARSLCPDREWSTLAVVMTVADDLLKSLSSPSSRRRSSGSHASLARGRAQAWAEWKCFGRLADESLALIDHYRIVRAGLYKGFGAASEIGDCNALALIAGGSRGFG